MIIHTIQQLNVVENKCFGVTLVMHKKHSGEIHKEREVFGFSVKSFMIHPPTHLSFFPSLNINNSLAPNTSSRFYTSSLFRNLVFTCSFHGKLRPSFALHCFSFRELLSCSYALLEPSTSILRRG